MMVLLLKALAFSFFFTLGMEIALGLCFAIGRVAKGVSKNERH